MDLSWCVVVSVCTGHHGDPFSNHAASPDGIFLEALRDAGSSGLSGNRVDAGETLREVSHLLAQKQD